MTDFRLPLGQALTDWSYGIVDMISRTVFLPFGHRVDEMEAIRVSGDRQHRFVAVEGAHHIPLLDSHLEF
jgi:hypothetical protein